MTSVAHAYLKIIPSLQGLGRHLRDQVRQAEGEAPKVSLAADLKTALLKEQLRAAAREGDQTAVRLLAELDATPAETRFERLLRRLSGRSVSVRVDADRSLGSAVSGLGSLLGGLGVGAARLASFTATVGGALSTLSGLGSMAVSASGALLLLPAAGVAAGAAIGTLKLGLSGFSDALKEDDPTKYAEAVGKFPPSMASAANAIRGLRPEFAGLRAQVQQRLFAGMAGEIDALAGRYLPVLRAGLGQMAGSLNQGARGFTAFAREGRTVGDLRTILDNSSTATGRLAQAVRPLLQVVRDLAAVGSGFLPGFASGLAGAAQRLAEFVSRARETGQLRTWMQNGINTVREIFTILGDVLAIIGSVFSALREGGAGVGGFLGPAIATIKEFVQSADGREVFRTLGEAISRVSAVVSRVLKVALEQLGPLVPPLADAFAKLVEQAGPLLESAIRIGGGLLAGLVRFISDNIDWLGPLAIAIGAVTAAQWAWNVAMDANPIGAAILAIGAIIALAQLIIDNWGPITDFFKDVAIGIEVRWNSFRDFWVDLWNTVWKWASDRITDLSNYVNGRVLDIISAFNWLGELPGRVGTWFEEVRLAIVLRLNDAVEWVRSLPGRIRDALGNMRLVLLDAGADLMRGLIDGITFGFDWVKENSPS
ncbi:hypothetical protein [Amycolatopsis anabasis]|uniref:hypothetical protein n=1 Tax=Amycolatopsis anabasis TaxID=1840409 RepID=UPI00131B79F7|nr:hypothetical protein [Amycolatopsis anabasis]